MQRANRTYQQKITSIVTSPYYIVFELALFEILLHSNTLIALVSWSTCMANLHLVECTTIQCPPEILFKISNNCTTCYH